MCVCVCYVYCNRGGSLLVSQAIGAWYRGHLFLFGMCLKSDGENSVDLFSIFLIVGGQPLAI